MPPVGCLGVKVLLAVELVAVLVGSYIAVFGAVVGNIVGHLDSALQPDFEYYYIGCPLQMFLYLLP